MQCRFAVIAFLFSSPGWAAHIAPKAQESVVRWQVSNYESVRAADRQRTDPAIKTYVAAFQGAAAADVTCDDVANLFYKVTEPLPETSYYGAFAVCNVVATDRRPFMVNISLEAKTPEDIAAVEEFINLTSEAIFFGKKPVFHAADNVIANVHIQAYLRAKRSFDLVNDQVVQRVFPTAGDLILWIKKDVKAAMAEPDKEMFADFLARLIAGQWDIWVKSSREDAVKVLQGANVIRVISDNQITYQGQGNELLHVAYTAMAERNCGTSMCY